MKKPKLFYREEDGHTYVWSNQENDWICFPTYANGEPDWLAPILGAEIQLDEKEATKLRDFLNEALPIKAYKMTNQINKGTK